ATINLALRLCNALIASRASNDSLPIEYRLKSDRIRNRVTLPIARNKSCHIRNIIFKRIVALNIETTDNQSVKETNEKFIIQ
ncbi:unnamed protein product, partial [Heterotrigona itama]